MAPEGNIGARYYQATSAAESIHVLVIGIQARVRTTESEMFGLFYVRDVFKLENLL